MLQRGGISTSGCKVQSYNENLQTSKSLQGASYQDIIIITKTSSSNPVGVNLLLYCQWLH